MILDMLEQEAPILDMLEQEAPTGPVVFRRRVSCAAARTSGVVRLLVARCAAIAFAFLYVTWKKSNVGCLAKHVVAFTGQGVAFVAGYVRL